MWGGAGDSPLPWIRHYFDYTDDFAKVCEGFHNKTHKCAVPTKDEFCKRRKGANAHYVTKSILFSGYPTNDVISRQFSQDCRNDLTVGCVSGI